MGVESCPGLRKPADYYSRLVYNTHIHAAYNSDHDTHSGAFRDGGNSEAYFIFYVFVSRLVNLITLMILM